MWRTRLDRIQRRPKNSPIQHGSMTCQNLCLLSDWLDDVIPHLVEPPIQKLATWRGLPSPIGSQRTRFENGSSIRNIKLPKKPASKCGTQTMFSQLPGSSELTGRIPNQSN